MSAVNFSSTRSEAGSRGRRRVNESNPLLQRPARKVLRVLIIIAEHVIRIGLGRGGTSSHVKDGLCILEIVEVLDEVIRVEVVKEPQRRKIFPLLGLVRAIDDKDVVMAELIEPPHNCTTDKPGTAGYDDSFHLRIFSRGFT